ncbi:hypothetical protein ES705_37174 [subsurface metagenome]
MAHREALRISEDLVRTSDLNLVYYYRKEIRACNLGLVPKGVRRRLIISGVVRHSHPSGHTGSSYVLTPRGEVLLEEV